MADFYAADNAIRERCDEYGGDAWSERGPLVDGAAEFLPAVPPARSPPQGELPFDQTPAGGDGPDRD